MASGTVNSSTRDPRQNDRIVIDLAEVFGVLWHNIILLLIVTIVFGVAGFLFSRYVLPVEYESVTSIYILDKSSNNGGSTTYSDLQVGSQLTKDYTQLIKSRYVIDAELIKAFFLTAVMVVVFATSFSFEFWLLYAFVLCLIERQSGEYSVYTE